MSTSVTFMERLETTQNRPSGFDYLRVILACSVVFWHTVVVSYGIYNQDYIVKETIVRPFVVMILPMFFALSGFLVAGSLERSKTLINFLGLRVLRIFPALIMEVTLSALLLGPLLTTLPLWSYFTDPVFGAYLLNIFGYIHYRLPGVFAGNPLPGVINGQLWTVPYELECYIALALLALLGLHRRRPFVLAAVVGFQLLFLGRVMLGPENDPALVPARVLVLSFLVGVAFYLYRDRVRWSGTLAVFSFAAAALLPTLQQGTYFVSLPAAYLTVYLGLLNPAKLRLLDKGDYSYGIFLYGFPIQQTVASFGPWAHHWWLNLLLSAPFIVIAAVFSWHVVEKNMLKLRRYLPRLEAALLDAGRLLLRGVRRYQIQSGRPEARS